MKYEFLHDNIKFDLDDYNSIKESNPLVPKQEVGWEIWKLKVSSSCNQYTQTQLDHVFVITVFENPIHNTRVSINPSLLTPFYQGTYNYLFVVKVNIKVGLAYVVGGICKEDFDKSKVDIANPFVSGTYIYNLDVIHINKECLVNNKQMLKENMIKKRDEARKKRLNVYCKEPIVYSVSDFTKGFVDNGRLKIFIFGMRKVDSSMNNDSGDILSNLTWDNIGNICTARVMLNEEISKCPKDRLYGDKESKEIKQKVLDTFNPNLLRLLDIFDKDTEISTSYMAMLDYACFKLLLMFLITYQSVEFKLRFIEGEKRIIRKQLHAFDYREDDILSFLCYNGLLKSRDDSSNIPSRNYPFFIEEDIDNSTRSVCEMFFKEEFGKEEINPVFWISCDVALALSSESLRPFYIKKGRAFISYLHLKHSIIPNIQEMTVHRYLFRYSNSKEAKDALLMNVSDTFGDSCVSKGIAPSNPIDVDMDNEDTFPLEFLDFAKPVIDFLDKLEHDKKKTIRKGISLPDIEDIGKSNMPLCMLRMDSKLRKTGHLIYDERQQFTGYLLDLNYSVQQGKEHMRKYYKGSLSTTSQQSIEQDISASLSETRITNKNGNGYKYFNSYCSNLIKSEEMGDRKVGCPFSNKDEVSLRDMISESGTIDDHVVDEIIKSRFDNPRKACALHFNALHGTPQQDPLKNEEWVPYIPFNWTILALSSTSRLTGK